MKHVLIAIGAIIFFIVIMVGYVIGGVNRAHGMDEDVKEQWGQVEISLKRRFDLIPNLVGTVKGIASHEKDVFSAIAEARKGYAGTSGGSVSEKARAAGQYESAIARLLVIVEKYPDLKSNQSFLKLQDELAGTENRIAVARKRYNNKVKVLNVFTRKFPSRMFASMAGVEAMDYFEVAEAEREVPAVDFTPK